MSDIMFATLIGAEDEKEYHTRDILSFDELPEQKYLVKKIEIEFYDDDMFIDRMGVEGETLDMDETQEFIEFLEAIDYMEDNVPFDFYETVAHYENIEGIGNLQYLAERIQDYHFFDIQDEDEGVDEDEKFAIHLLNMEMVDEHLVKLWNEKPHMIDLEGVYRDYRVDWCIDNGWAWMEN